MPAVGPAFTRAPGDTVGTLTWTPLSADVRPERYRVVFSASNALGAADTARIRVVAPVAVSVSLDRRIAAGADDVEESASGSVSTNSSDLELVNDGNNQVVGLRFTGLAIPRGAQITNAYVQFKVDETGSAAASLAIHGQAGPAAAFTTAARNVSSRTRTASSVAWNPADWSTVGQAGAAQRTPNLAAIVQEVVASSSWQSGNALALILTGTGKRTAEAFEDDAPGAPLLHVDYTTGPPVNQAPVVDAGPDRTVTRPAEAILDGAVTDDGLPTATVTRLWSVDAGPGLVTFTGGVNLEDTRAGFSQAGSYLLRLTASDGERSASDTVRVTVQEPGAIPLVIDRRIAAGADDVEESASGSVSSNSSDLELVNDGNNQVVGLRFTGLAIPRGAQITNAYVQFKVDETGSAAASLAIRGQAGPAAAFTTAARNVSSRTRTAATVAWSPAAWPTTGQAGAAQRTPNLAAIVQEIVASSSWQSGNALALILTGTGKRTAEAFEDDAPGAPLLHVEMVATGADAAALADGPGDPGPGATAEPQPIALGMPPIRGHFGARVVPNPTRSSATFQLVTANAGPARVDLFDPAGRRVLVIHESDDLAAGAHSFAIPRHGEDGRRLAAGVYFYRVRVHGGSGGGKLLVLE